MTIKKCHPEFISGFLMILNEMLKPACRQAWQVQHDKVVNIETSSE